MIILARAKDVERKANMSKKIMMLALAVISVAFFALPAMALA
jgi:hypothetical protein